MRAAGSTTPDPREWAPSPAWPRGARRLPAAAAAGRAPRRAPRLARRRRGETWIDDPANGDPRFARSRARAAGASAGRRTAEPPRRSRSPRQADRCRRRVISIARARPATRDARGCGRASSPWPASARRRRTPAGDGARSACAADALRRRRRVHRHPGRQRASRPRRGPRPTSSARPARPTRGGLAPPLPRGRASGTAASTSRRPGPTWMQPGRPARRPPPRTAARAASAARRRARGPCRSSRRGRRVTVGPARGRRRVMPRPRAPARRGGPR